MIIYSTFTLCTIYTSFDTFIYKVIKINRNYMSYYTMMKIHSHSSIYRKWGKSCIGLCYCYPWCNLFCRIFQYVQMFLWNSAELLAYSGFMPGKTPLTYLLRRNSQEEANSLPRCTVWWDILVKLGGLYAFGNLYFR